MCEESPEIANVNNSRHKEPSARGSWLLTGIVALIGLYYWFEHLRRGAELAPMNELGDFLGGMGSALALIWIIQAYKLTRYQLLLTRDQLELNRAEVAASVGALKKSEDEQSLQRDLLRSLIEQFSAASKASNELVKQTRGLVSEQQAVVEAQRKHNGLLQRGDPSYIEIKGVSLTVGDSIGDGFRNEVLLKMRIDVLTGAVRNAGASFVQTADMRVAMDWAPLELCVDQSFSALDVYSGPIYPGMSFDLHVPISCAFMVSGGPVKTWWARIHLKAPFDLGPGSGAVLNEELPFETHVIVVQATLADTGGRDSKLYQVKASLYSGRCGSSTIQEWCDHRLLKDATG